MAQRGGRSFDDIIEEDGTIRGATEEEYLGVVFARSLPRLRLTHSRLACCLLSLLPQVVAPLASPISPSTTPLTTSMIRSRSMRATASRRR